MKVTFLGTASCFPTPIRGVSSLALQLDNGEVWLFDCGEGTQIQIMKSQVKPGKITKIFITHLHGDHCFGLPGLLSTLGQIGEPDDGRVLDLYGPVGIAKMVNTFCEVSRTQFKFRLDIHELEIQKEQCSEDWDSWGSDFSAGPNEKINSTTDLIKFTPPDLESGDNGYWEVFKSCDSNYVVRAGILIHRIPCFGYVIREKKQPGNIDVEKCKGLGLSPGPMYGQLKAGKTVVVSEREIFPEMVLGPSRPGRKVAIFGDVSDASRMTKMCMNADLLIHEATMENALKEKAMEYGHSTPDMAAQFAIDCQAKRLCLFHVSPRYRPKLDISKQAKEGQTYEEMLKTFYGESAEKLKDEAVEHFEQKGYKCAVEVAEDFMTIVIPPLKG